MLESETGAQELGGAAFDSRRWIRMVVEVIGFIVIPSIVVALILYVEKAKKSSAS